MTNDDTRQPDQFANWIAERENELALALGRFAIEFARMEDTLNRTIHEVLGLQSDTGYALTSAIMNVSTRLDILSNLVKQIRLYDGYAEIIGSALTAAFEINSERNWLLHDAWSEGMILRADRGPPRFKKRRMRPRAGGRAWQLGVYSAPEIDAIRKRCEEAADALAPLVDTMKNERLLKEITDQGI
jgi:hypothetical protein